MKPQIPKPDWIAEIYKLLCVSQGAPANETEEKNLRQWAELLADSDAGYYNEGLSPKEAHDEELSCA